MWATFTLHHAPAVRLGLVQHSLAAGNQPRPREASAGSVASGLALALLSSAGPLASPLLHACSGSQPPFAFPLHFGRPCQQSCPRERRPFLSQEQLSQGPVVRACGTGSCPPSHPPTTTCRLLHSNLRKTVLPSVTNIGTPPVQTHRHTWLCFFFHPEWRVTSTLVGTEIRCHLHLSFHGLSLNITFSSLL